MDLAEIIEFAESKLKSAELSLRQREDMERVWRSGTDESWKKACAIHPATAGKAMSKAERLKEAETHQRIAAKCRYEVEMFKAVVDALKSS